MNNKKMNQMRESIKKQNFAYVGIILFSAALFILGIAKKVSMVYYTRTYTGEE